MCAIEVVEALKTPSPTGVMYSSRCIRSMESDIDDDDDDDGEKKKKKKKKKLLSPLSFVLFVFECKKTHVSHKKTTTQTTRSSRTHTTNKNGSHYHGISG